MVFLTYIHYRDACNHAVVDCRFRMTPTRAVIWSVSGTIIYLFCFCFVLYVWDNLNKDIVLLVFEQGMIFCQWSDLLICKKSQMIFIFYIYMLKRHYNVSVFYHGALARCISLFCHTSSLTGFFFDSFEIIESVKVLLN